MDQGSSLLLGIEGLIVDRVLIDDAGQRVVHCSTGPELAGWCPEWATPRDSLRTITSTNRRQPAEQSAEALLPSWAGERQWLGERQG